MSKIQESDRTTIFIQEIDPSTTIGSLRKYLASHDYHSFRCTVPTIDGHNKHHAIVSFDDTRDVDQFMNERPHYIDGKLVFVHRKTPESKWSSRESRQFQHLRVLNVPAKFNHSDIENYFEKYGSIIDLWRSPELDECWIIKFDDYDSVDKALWDWPYRIRGCAIELEKDKEPSKSRSDTPNGRSNSTRGSVTKHVRIDERASYYNSSMELNSIHIENLPEGMNANRLSSIFKWPLHTIVMKQSEEDPDVCKECWLIDNDRKMTLGDIDQLWQNSDDSEIRIRCEKTQIRLALCSKFRNDECSKDAKSCHWVHQCCPAPADCSSSCPYGHPAGSKKTGPMPPGTFSSLEIRVSGFRSPISSDDLAEKLSITKQLCSRYSNRPLIASVKVATLKYAQALIQQWQNREIDGATLHFQIICCSSNRTQSTVVPSDTSVLRARSASRPNNPMIKRDLTDSSSTTHVHQQVNRVSRIDTSSVKTKPNLPIGILLTSSSKRDIETLPNGLSTRWQIVEKISIQNPSIFHVEERRSPDRLATIKIYEQNMFDQYQRECETLKVLTSDSRLKKIGPQLIECDSDGSRHWILMERVVGCSLREFVNNEKQTDNWTLQKSIQCVENLLLGIVKLLHERQIYHQKISPDHILIDKNRNPNHIDPFQFRLINFSYGVLCKSDSTDKNYFTYSMKDYADLCAVFLWLITNINLEFRANGWSYDQHVVREKIRESVRSTDRSRKSRIIIYLMDTFNRAFDYPSYHPWTLVDLEVRFKAIHELIKRSKGDDNVDTIFEELLSIPDDALPKRNSLFGMHEKYRTAFEKAARIIEKTKESFIEKCPNSYQWCDGWCVWTDISNDSFIECRHDDTLTFSRQTKRSSEQYKMIISFFAHVNKIDQTITISIGTTFNGKRLSIPIIYDRIDADYEINFEYELKSLLVALLKEKKGTS